MILIETKEHSIEQHFQHKNSVWTITAVIFRKATINWFFLTTKNDRTKIDNPLSQKIMSLYCDTFARASWPF